MLGEGDSFISPFSLRLRDVRGAVAEMDVSDVARGDASPATRIAFRLDEAAWPAPGWRARPVDAAALVVRLAHLDLRVARVSDLSAFYRRETAAGRWAWMATSIRENGRDVMIELDLRTESGGAADLCRSLPIMPLQSVTSDRCTIEAIVDGATGWPLVVRMTRSVSATNRASAMESITFERLPPWLETTHTPTPVTDRR